MIQFNSNTPDSLKRVAIFQIRCHALGPGFLHVVAAKPLHTFARHALLPMWANYSAATRRAERVPVERPRTSVATA
ncbi:hypothetical protein GFM02_08330 [Rhizobium leguminosarum bv. viciae]|nr:hypothetical protein [Rhizobium leguminosarum bv. viciae]